jgi:hypothetical protein
MRPTEGLQQRCIKHVMCRVLKAQISRRAFGMKLLKTCELNIIIAGSNSF